MHQFLTSSPVEGLCSHTPCRLLKAQSTPQPGCKQQSQARKQRNPKRQVCKALSTPSNVQVSDKRKSLLRFVQDVQAHDTLEDFQQTSPAPVIDAMRTTVTNMLGTLPPSYFHVTTIAEVEDMAQMMFSMMMTGYMYRNGQYRMELDHVRRLHDDDEHSEPAVSPRSIQRLGSEETSLYAAGTQVTRVSGEVLRWRKDTEELEQIPAQSYIQNCEDEIASLRAQLSRMIYAKGSGNELLDFIKVQEPAQLKELTENASAAVYEAMNSFVQRLIGNSARRMEVNHQELARIFYFLLVVGYQLRQLEVKFDFESSFTVPSLNTSSLDSPD